MTSVSVQSAANGWVIAVSGEMGLMGMVREPQIYVAPTYGELESILRQIFGQSERVPVPPMFTEAFAEPEPEIPPGGLAAWPSVTLRLLTAQQTAEPEPDPEPPPKPKKPKHK